MWCHPLHLCGHTKVHALKEKGFSQQLAASHVDSVGLVCLTEWCNPDPERQWSHVLTHMWTLVSNLYVCVSNMQETENSNLWDSENSSHWWGVILMESIVECECMKGKGKIKVREGSVSRGKRKSHMETCYFKSFTYHFKEFHGSYPIGDNVPPWSQRLVNKKSSVRCGIPPLNLDAPETPNITGYWHASLIDWLVGLVFCFVLFG